MNSPVNAERSQFHRRTSPAAPGNGASFHKHLLRRTFRRSREKERRGEEVEKGGNCGTRLEISKFTNGTGISFRRGSGKVDGLSTPLFAAIYRGLTRRESQI